MIDMTVHAPRTVIGGPAVCDECEKPWPCPDVIAARDRVMAAPVQDPFALTPGEVMRCAVLYFFNVDPDDQLEAVRGKRFERPDDPYRQEKLGHWRAGLVEWFNRFDYQRQQLWIAAAIAKYRDEVIAERLFYGMRGTEIR